MNQLFRASTTLSTAWQQRNTSWDLCKLGDISTNRYQHLWTRIFHVALNWGLLGNVRITIGHEILRLTLTGGQGLEYGGLIGSGLVDSRVRKRAKFGNRSRQILRISTHFLVECWIDLYWDFPLLKPKEARFFMGFSKVEVDYWLLMRFMQVPMILLVSLRGVESISKVMRVKASFTHPSRAG